MVSQPGKLFCVNGFSLKMHFANLTEVIQLPYKAIKLVMLDTVSYTVCWTYNCLHKVYDVILAYPIRKF